MRPALDTCTSQPPIIRPIRLLVARRMASTVVQARYVSIMRGFRQLLLQTPRTCILWAFSGLAVPFWGNDPHSWYLVPPD